MTTEMVQLMRVRAVGALDEHQLDHLGRHLDIGSFDRALDDHAGAILARLGIGQVRAVIDAVETAIEPAARWRRPRRARASPTPRNSSPSTPAWTGASLVRASPPQPADIGFVLADQHGREHVVDDLRRGPRRYRRKTLAEPDPAIRGDDLDHQAADETGTARARRRAARCGRSLLHRGRTRRP
eukprot:gene45842-62086_t